LAAKIKEALQDPRITTELVDNLPASGTVPTPLKSLGGYVDQPGELTYARDIHRYYEHLAKVSPRARFQRARDSHELSHAPLRASVHVGDLLLAADGGYRASNHHCQPLAGACLRGRNPVESHSNGGTSASPP
jgi:hypothetical protein